MAQTRDRIIHGYFTVNYSIVWDTLKNEIPELQLTIAQILGEMKEGKPMSDKGAG